jgi:hypothetical protein
MGDSFCWRQWCAATLAVAVVYCGLDYLFHEIVLKGQYIATAELWRTPAEIEPRMWVLFAGYGLFALVFTSIYHYGYNPAKTAISQGIRYGLLMGLLRWGAGGLLDYPFVPAPDHLYRAWFGIGLGEYVILGIVLALIYRPKTA